MTRRFLVAPPRSPFASALSAACWTLLLLSALSATSALLRADELPDLVVVTSFTEPALPYPGQTVNVFVRVRNQGSQSTIVGFLTAMEIYDPGNHLVFSNRGSSGPLGAGQMTDVALGAWTAGAIGDYRATQFVDHTNTVVEANEANQQGANLLRVEGDPDLIVASVRTNPFHATRGQSSQLVVTVSNPTARDLPMSTFSTSISIGTFSTSAVVTTAIPGRGFVSIPMPARWTPRTDGRQTFHARVDTGGSVPEADETNNTLTDYLQIGAVSSSSIGVLVLSYVPDEDRNRLVDRALAVPGATNQRGGLTTTQLRSDISAQLSRTLTRMNRATRYHGDRSSAQSSRTFQVIGQVERSVRPPAYAPGGSGRRLFDYSAMLSTITPGQSVCDYVDGRGVQQVWVFSGWEADSEVPVGQLGAGPNESNMAMGRISRPFWNHDGYGDVSNSDQTNDLPTCLNTYVMFNYEIYREDGMLEDHQHHVERVVPFVDPNGFFASWSRPYGYCTPDGDGECSRLPAGDTTTVRGCGWGHQNPNSIHQYTYNNPVAVASACQYWQPEGVATITQVSCQNWYGPSGCSPAGDTADGVYAAKVWWMQQLPGTNNGLSYHGRAMRSWWDAVADLDEFLAGGRSLLVTASP